MANGPNIFQMLPVFFKFKHRAFVTALKCTCSRPAVNAVLIINKRTKERGADVLGDLSASFAGLCKLRQFSIQQSLELKHKTQHPV